MKKVVFFCSLLMVFLVTSCAEDDKAECDIPLALRDCFSGIVSFRFQVMENGENVFANNQFTIDDVSISGPDGAQSELQLRSGFENAENPILIISNRSWGEGDYVFNISFDERAEFEIRFNTDLSPPSLCCGSIPLLQEIQINNEVPTEIENSNLYILTLN